MWGGWSVRTGSGETGSHNADTLKRSKAGIEAEYTRYIGLHQIRLVDLKMHRGRLSPRPEKVPGAWPSLAGKVSPEVTEA